MMYRVCVSFFVLAVAGASPVLAASPAAMHWSASVFGATSTVVNGRFSAKPQYGFDVSGQKGALTVQARMASVDSWVGADSENRFTASYAQALKTVNLRYQVQYKLYPGTKPGFTSNGIIYQVTASKSLGKVNYAVGVDYGDADYATVRKSYGLNLSVSRGLLPKLSGWASVSHHHQYGSADYTNTNIGLWYQATAKIGVSTSLNLYHAYASWNVDHPTLSIGLSRRL